MSDMEPCRRPYSDVIVKHHDSVVDNHRLSLPGESNCYEELCSHDAVHVDGQTVDSLSRSCRHIHLEDSRVIAFHL